MTLLGIKKGLKTVIKEKNRLVQALGLHHHLAITSLRLQSYPDLKACHVLYACQEGHSLVFLRIMASFLGHMLHSMVITNTGASRLMRDVPGDA